MLCCACYAVSFMQCLKMNNEILPVILSLTHLRNVLLYTYLQKRNRRRWWVRYINQQREQQGIYNNMFKELYFTDEEQFFEYMRMNKMQFDYLLSLVGPSLQKKSLRKPLPARLRLVVTLSYLASGDSPKYLSKYYRIGASTIYKVIHETCESIWETIPFSSCSTFS